jgi:tetratricopeptide (TPR) repeat protein
MSARRRKRKKRGISDSPSAASLKTAVPQPPRPKLSKRRKWLFRLTALVLVPVLFFTLLEAGLRVGGYGYPTTFFIGPEPDGTSMSNPRFGWRFFPPSLARRPVPCFLTTKPSGAVRIFVLGGSTAQGVPEPSFSFGRILEVMLRDRYPGVRFEVVNAAMTAINSHVALPIARDCAAWQPDLFVVYMGNNEVVGPYGPGTVFQQWSPSLKFIRASIWVKSTRVGQLLGDVIRWFHPRDDSPTEWRGMEMFLGNQVAADDPRLASVYDNYRQNLIDICGVARRAGAAVILSTVAVNLKDCPPLASRHRSDLSLEELARWESLYQAGVERESSDRWQEAAEQYEAAARIDDRFAELQFRLGRCLAALRRFKEARDRFILARDLDALRFRADTRINATIREVAAEQEASRVCLTDAEQELAKNDPASGGILGGDLFYEHVHLTFDGNYLLARAILDQVDAALPQLAASRRQGPALTRQQSADALALTPWDEYQLANIMAEVTSRPPFNNQLDHALREVSARERVEHLRQLASSPEALQAACRTYEAALAKTPDDWELHHRFGQLATASGRPEVALDHLQIALKKLSSEPAVHIDFAKAAQKCGRIKEALAHFEKAVELDPGSAMAHHFLALALSSSGRIDEAIPHFQKTLEIDPECARAHYDLGNALSGRGRSDEAIAQFQKALEINPQFADAHNSLGVVLAGRGRTEEAIAHFLKALEINPQFAIAHNNLGLTLESRGRLDEAIDHFQKALEVDPQSAIVHNNLAKALANRGRIDEAIPHFQKALQIQPDYAEARKNLDVLRASRAHGSGQTGSGQ